MPFDPQKHGYVVLQRFMIDDLSLTGDELIVFAIIHGFCQDGRSSCRCTRGYFAYWLGKSKSTVNRIIDSLVAKGYIVRSHEVVNGQTMPRYILGKSAPTVRPGRLDVVAEGSEGPETPSDGGYAGDKGGTPTDPPYHAENVENSVLRGGEGGPPTYPRYAGGPPVRTWEPITDTDTNTSTETESDGNSGGMDGLLRDFNALKPFMPCTDGFAFGFENYRALRVRGFSAEEIAEAARRTTAELRKDYPDRPAKYFPHAERLLAPGNLQGICGHLDRRRAATLREPTDRELFICALTSDAGSLTSEALSLNDSIVRSAVPEEREARRRDRDEWLAANRRGLLDLWRSKRGAGRDG